MNHTASNRSTIIATAIAAIAAALAILILNLTGPVAGTTTHRASAVATMHAGLDATTSTSFDGPPWG